MMEAREALAARKSLGLSQDDAASDFDLTPDVVAAWESGEIPVPKRIEEKLRWRLAAKERLDALATSGLPECEWRKAWEARITPSDLKALAKYYEEETAHAKGCPLCQAREKYIQDRFGNMPPAPTEGWVKVIGLVADRIERFPRWAQPAGWMAIAFGLYSLVRIVFTLPALARNPKYWSVALTGLGLSISIGALVGLIYGGFRELRSKLGARRAA